MRSMTVLICIRDFFWVFEQYFLREICIDLSGEKYFLINKFNFF